jgi:hypothetical protein
MRYKLSVLATAILIASGTAASARGIGSVMAPGSALPANAGLGGVHPGGIGPGLTSVSPGPSTGRMIQNLGFGNTQLSIGSYNPTLRSANRAVN